MVSIGTTWDRTVDFVRGHMAQVASIALLTQFLPTVATGSLARLRETAGGALSLGLGLLTLVTSLIALWGSLYLVAYAAQQTGRESAANARGIANRRFLPVLGVSLALLVVMAVLAIPAIGLAYAGGFNFAAIAAGTRPTPDQLGSLGWALLYMVVAGLFVLWAIARLLPVNAVIAMERRGLGAIGRAFALTRGMGLKLVGLVILYAIIAGVAVSAAQFVVGAVFAIVTSGGSGVTVGDVAGAIATGAISALLALYQAAFIGKLYRGIVGDQDDVAVFA
jgi:hypothetical protein